MRVIVAMTGATGSIFGIRLLERLRDFDDVETHLICSKWARFNIQAETTYTPAQVESLADVVHTEGNQGAAISSGSFRVDAMAVAPCSMRTLAAIRHGLADNLIARAADVVLKERRNLCLMPRETPFSAIHLDNMLALARMGVGICPPMPAFYNRPATLDDLVDHITVRMLDQLGLEVDHGKRWTGVAGQSDRNGKRLNGEIPNGLKGTRSTLMWEAAADDPTTHRLRHWVKVELRQRLLDVDPKVQIEIYFNDDGRVVVVATGNIVGFQPPPVPRELARRDAQVWRFVRDIETTAQGIATN
jgi:flavin prenyltransferase